jgi:hypothetical protein
MASYDAHSPPARGGLHESRRATLFGRRDRRAPWREQEARKALLLARLQAMKVEGLGTQAIATRLNREGVLTLSGRG